jgi:hypothetical protein
VEPILKMANSEKFVKNERKSAVIYDLNTDMLLIHQKHTVLTAEDISITEHVKNKPVKTPKFLKKDGAFYYAYFKLANLL